MFHMALGDLIKNLGLQKKKEMPEKLKRKQENGIENNFGGSNNG